MVDSDRGRVDGRTAAQRRADALTEICRQWLDRSDRPHIGGERPHLNVLIDLSTLRGAHCSLSETDRGTVLDPDSVRRLACDASISRIIVNGHSQIIDVGRLTRTVPPATRRAIVTRDRHCRFPGCDRPPAWCDVHHIVPWARGGATDLDNLILLCRAHHRTIHKRRFRLTGPGGDPAFSRSDGSPLPTHRSPPQS
jgi:5-methylcytosine-specific restriction protein A